MEILLFIQNYEDRNICFCRYNLKSLMKNSNIIFQPADLEAELMDMRDAICEFDLLAILEMIF